MDPATKKYYCLCCGYATLEEEAGSGSYEICQVCDWEDDNVQAKDPDFSGGANEPSLNEAKKNFKEIGASDEKAAKRRAENETEEERQKHSPAGLARDPNYVEPQ